MPDRVRSALEDVHADIAVSAPPAGQLRAVVERLADRRRRRRRLGIAGGSVLAATLVAVGVVAVQRNDANNSLSIVTEPSTLTSETVTTEAVTTDDTMTTEAVTTDATVTTGGTDATVTTGGTRTSTATGSTDVESPWLQQIPDPPLTERAAALVRSAGSSLVVWGGGVPNHLDGSEPPFNDGAVFDGEIMDWRPMAPSPLPGGPATGVWTGTELVISNAGNVAAYDPAADRWRDLAAPTTAGLDFVTMLGTEAFFLPAAVAWNSADGTWRSFAAPPPMPSDPHLATWSGTIVAFGASIETAPLGIGLQYDPAADQWTTLPAGPIEQVYDGVAAAVTGNELVVVSWLDMSAAALDLVTREWRTLPRFPAWSVKCPATAAAVPADIVVVSMCGPYAALTPGAEHWTSFDPPSRSTFFELLHHAEGLVVDGSLLDVSDPAWTSSPALGPVTLGDLTIDRSAGPEQVTSDADSLSARLATTSCTILARRSSRDDMQTLAEAALVANDAPDSIEFWNTTGDYSLTCPSAAAYDAALSAFMVRGELSSPVDALATIESAALGPAASPEEVIEATAEVLGERHTSNGRSPSIGLSGPSGAPLRAVIDVYTFEDGSTDGYSYTVTLAETGQGWTVSAATVRSICTRGASAGEPSVCV